VSRRTTFDLPEKLYLQLCHEVRRQGINLSAGIEMAVHLLLKHSPAEIGEMLRPLDGLDSADRKRVVRYAKFLKVAQADLKAVCASRIDGFLAVADREHWT
jgi:hypothetical protein